MKKGKRRLTNYQDLSEYRKDKILEHIRRKGKSIKSAALDLGVTATTINKIFRERFGKRGEIKDPIKTIKVSLNNKKELNDIKK